MSKRIRYVTLDRKVIVVAVEGDIKDWAAYIGAVPGNNHYAEYMEVARQGTKLPREVASILFPDFDRSFCWRP